MPAPPQGAEDGPPGSPPPTLIPFPVLVCNLVLDVELHLVLVLLGTVPGYPLPF